MKIDLVQPIQLLASADDGTSSRTIQGIAIPYGTEANASTGPVRVLAGALPTDGPAPKLLMNHDPNLPVGVVTERVDTGTEMLFSAKVSKTTAGDEALVLAMDGVYDGVSVGLNATAFHYDGNTLVVEAAEWRELSLVTFPAFEGARITQVAATEATDTPEDPVLDEPTEPSEEEPMSEIIESSQATAPIVIGGAVARPRVTAAEYLSAVITGKPTPVLAADNLLTDIPGLLPDELTGPIWNTQSARRPIIDAVGARALPQYGEQFRRRFISQHTAVGQQINELDNLSSNQLVVSTQTFQKKTFGGYVQVSSQSELWSEPALVQALIEDMIRQYARATEAYVATQIAAVYTQASDTIASFVDGDDVIEGIYNGAAEMYAAVDVMPTHMIVSSSVWAQMGQAKTANGDYIFPYLNPSNAAGQYASGAAVMNGNPLGLAMIVSDDLSANPTECVLLYAPALEVYEDRSRTGGIRIENPATASATVGLWGFLAADLINPLAPANCPYALSLV